MPHRKAALIRLIVLAVFAAVLVLSLGGCAGVSRREGPEKSAQDLALERAREENTPDAREYVALDTLYRQKKHEETLKRSQKFFKSFPKSQFTDQVYNLRGLSLIGLKQYQAAIPQLRKTIELTRSESLRSMAAYNLGYIHFELGQVDNALAELDSVRPMTLGRNDRVKLYVLRAKIGRLKQDFAGSARDILLAIQDTPEPRSASALEPMATFLDEVLEPISNTVVLQRLLTDFEDSPVADRLMFQLASRYLAAGDREAATPYFERLTSQFPQSKYYSQAQENVRRAQSHGIIDPKKIGVVLTLSGKLGRFGYKALQGAELALKVFKGAKDAPKDPNAVTMIVIDDQGDPEQAAAAVETLFFKHHVAAIIGPLSSKLGEAVGKKAQELALPLIALTQKEAPGGDFVFNGALTPEMQVRELVRYAAEKAGSRQYAILAPSGRFGAEYAGAFWDELDRRSLALRGFETYPAEETDFRMYVDRLVGLSDADARGHEVEEMKLLKAATPVKGRSKKFDRMFDLKPVVDFQAVFIPDEPRALGQILPTFAYRDVDRMLFLGINTWNNPELITRAGQFAEGAVFVDGFYAGSQLPSTRRFIEEYRATFNAEPGLVEAMAYDAANILGSVLSTSAVASRAEVRDRIIGLRDFPGVAGKISYQAGRLTKRLTFLTVKNGKIEEIAF